MIGLKSNTLHYVKHVHFFFIFIKMKGLANRPQKCKKSEGDVSLYYLHFFVKKMYKVM